MSANSAKRQLALEKEYQQLLKVNDTMDTLINTIQKSQVDITKTKNSANHTTILLEKWIQILSQTEFTNKVLNNPKWDGTFGVNEILNDEAQDIKIEEKLNEEQLLIDELNRLENENDHLTNTLSAKEIRENELQQRRNDLASKRQRELGLSGRIAKGISKRRPFK